MRIFVYITEDDSVRRGSNGRWSSRVGTSGDGTTTVVYKGDGAKASTTVAWRGWGKGDVLILVFPPCLRHQSI